MLLIQANLSPPFRVPLVDSDCMLNMTQFLPIRSQVRTFVLIVTQILYSTSPAIGVSLRIFHVSCTNSEPICQHCELHTYHICQNCQHWAAFSQTKMAHAWPSFLGKESLKPACSFVIAAVCLWRTEAWPVHRNRKAAASRTQSLLGPSDFFTTVIIPEILVPPRLALIFASIVFCNILLQSTGTFMRTVWRADPQNKLSLSLVDMFWSCKNFRANILIFEINAICRQFAICKTVLKFKFWWFCAPTLYVGNEVCCSGGLRINFDPPIIFTMR